MKTEPIEPTAATTTTVGSSFTNRLHLVAKGKRKREPNARKVMEASADIVEALKPFDRETQIRILKSACILLDIPWPIA